MAASITGTVLLGIGAFWLSFTALTDLAARAGTPLELAWVWPLIVDGIIVIATMSVVALSPYGARATRYPWLLLAGAALVSVAANITHALVAADDTVPGVLAALVASVPPVVLLAVTHLTVELGRYRHQSPAAHHEPEQLTVTTLRAHSSERPALEASPTPATDAPDPESGSGTVRRRNNVPADARGAAEDVDGVRDRAVELHEQGLSNRQIAERLGVHATTVGRWLKHASAHAVEERKTDGRRS